MDLDHDASTPDGPRVAYGYLAPPGATRLGATVAAGGAAIAVSAAALRAIRASIVDERGRLPRTAAPVLARIDDREAHATELRLLLAALARREVFVRVLAEPGRDAPRPGELRAGLSPSKAGNTS